MQHLLNLEIQKNYPDFRLQAKMSVKESEFFSLVGPSGCGKTTLLRMVAGLEKPDCGRIILNGEDITDLPPAKRRIGLVFQDYALFPHLSVADNIAYGLKVQKLPVAEQQKQVKELLQLLALKEMEHREVSSLSGGEKQRVALARALAPRPSLLLLDEPFSALDYALRIKLRRELKNLQKTLGFAAIFVTHHQEEALSLSERLAVMQNGNIIQIDTPEKIYEQPSCTYVAEFLGDANLLPCQAVFNEGETIQVQLDNQFNLSLRNNLPTETVAGKSVLLMVRPEDFILNPEEAPFWSGEILESEYLGYACRVVVKAGDLKFTALLSKEHHFTPGAMIKIGINLTKVRLLQS